MYCRALVHALPAVCLILIVIYSYWSYVIEMGILIMQAQSWPKMVIYLVVYHFFFLLMVGMYFLAMCHKEWYVPERFLFSSEFYNKVNNSNSEDIEYKLLLAFCRAHEIKVYTRTASGGIRYCSDCRLLKPDRSHHCSICDACVIKMDHHCPWINNCVGFTNYKYFIILVLYSALYCTFYFCTAMEYMVAFFLNPAQLRQISIVICTFITMIIAVALWALFFFHIKLICKNETTIEAVHPPVFATAMPAGFDRGCTENFDEVCTFNVCYWCLPVNTASGNGVDFEVVTYDPYEYTDSQISRK